MWAKCLSVLVVAVLVAAAFFLPERLLAWGDAQLVDQLQTETREEAREGFAESVQLTVAEKVMLMRSGVLSGISLGDEYLQGRYTNASSASTIELNVEMYYWEGESAYEIYGVEPEEGSAAALTGSALPEDSASGERIRVWEERVRAVQAELRSLQSVGGLPQLWDAGTELICGCYGDVLYMDPDTRMSFQIYQMTLHGDPYDMEVLVDEATGRILAFNLRWSVSGLPNWGLRGAANFGGVWRDYWQMDSVATGWYEGHPRSILEEVEQQTWNNGDYSALGQITFLYNGDPISIPLECRGARSRSYAIIWNR